MEEINVERIIQARAERGKKIPSPITVSCEVLSYSANDKVTLELAETQGINPTILIVDAKIEKIEGPMKGTYKPVSVDFEDNEVYEKVTIRYIDEDEDEEVTVDILGF